VYVPIVLSCIMMWLEMTAPAVAWGPVAHAVIGEFAENALLKHHAGLRAAVRLAALLHHTLRP
jgi:hypothetical protein